MIKVIGVRFRTAGKIYFFDPLQFEIKKGDHVIVETARGIEYGTVVSGIREVEDDKVVQPLKPVIRIATERDCEQEAANKEKEREAYKICLEKIHAHGLDMKLIDAEYTFDNNKVLFYFTADGRIDFRELVKDLASVFKTRIELRQIGVRDETKIMGGIGICGRPLCCHSYLADFIPVSIKMAKEQNLSLNPTKISGVCGRLMCCLKNEEETYEELNRRLPNIGDFVTTEDGLKGEVQSVNVLRQLVKVVVDLNDEKEIREYEVDKLSFKKKHGKKEKLELTKEEMQELERLEKEEIQDGVQELEERRPERKPEGRQENRQDRRDEGRQENRQDTRNEGRQENRQNRRNEGRQEGRQDRRNDGRQNNRQNNRSGIPEEKHEFLSEGEVVQEVKADLQDSREGVREERPNRQENRRGQEYRQRRQENRGGNQEDRQNRQNSHQNNQGSASEEKQEFQSDARQDGRRDRRNDNRRGGRYEGRPNRYRERQSGKENTES